MPRLRVDDYLSRRFNIATQNCWHLVRDGWFELTGVDLNDRTPGRLTREALIARFQTDVPMFTKLPKAVDPCIVLMTKGPGVVPHVGLFYRGKVLQMEETGVTYLPMTAATRGYALHEVGFYR